MGKRTDDTKSEFENDFYFGLLRLVTSRNFTSNIKGLGFKPLS